MLTEKEVQDIWKTDAILPETEKPFVVCEYGKQFGCTTLVETGTNKGGTVAVAKNEFSRVYSIEIDPALHEFCQAKFAGDSNVHLLLGDSGDVLEPLLQKMAGDKQLLFWLDSHFDYGTKPSEPNPTSRELDAIFTLCPGSVILIDDARLFTAGEYTSNNLGAEYRFLNPRLEQLEQYVMGKDPALRFKVQDDIIRITPR